MIRSISLSNFELFSFEQNWAKSDKLMREGDGVATQDYILNFDNLTN